MIGINSGAAIQRITAQSGGGVQSARGQWIRRMNSSIWDPWRFMPTQRVDQNANVGRTIYTWDDINNREQLIYGDTGIREISSLLANGWTASSIKLSRVGHIVDVNISDLVTGTSTTVAQLPSGFRPPTALPVMGRPASNTDVPCYGTLDGSGNIGLIVGRTFNARSFQATFRTTDAWPTSLPGTAVGTIPNL